MTLILSNTEWTKILNRIRVENGLAASIRWKLKENYGFSVRHYRGFDIRIGRHVDDTRLDFDTESQATFFRLRFL